MSVIAGILSASLLLADVTVENPRFRLTVGADVTLHAEGMRYFTTPLPKPAIKAAFERR